MKRALFFSCVFLSSATSYSQDSTPHLYSITYHIPLSSEEKLMVNHTKSSYEKAMRRESKLNTNVKFSKDLRCNSQHGIIPYYHLVNNLNSLSGASHLHIGLYTGGSFVSCMYGNQNSLETTIGIDWFEGDWGFKGIFYSVCTEYLCSTKTPYNYQIISGDCFSTDKSAFKTPFNIYVYDADHSTTAHEQAFLYYDDTLTNVFISVIDDWNWERVRKGTFDAFDKLGYSVLYENEIPANDTMGNGQYVAVIRKKI